MNLRVLGLSIAILGVAVGCGSSEPTPAAGPPSSFTPAYYDGHAVFYDEIGIPYYIEEGRTVLISRHDERFGPLVSYYHQNRGEYREWERRMNREPSYDD